MSVLRQANILGQQRIDAPHLRAVESSICADFDLLAGRIIAGQRPVVVSGFELISTGITQAVGLQVNVQNGVVIHYFATDSGSMFCSAADRTIETLNPLNTRVKGGFTANQLNYIGLDFVRKTLDASRDLVSFIDPNTDAEAGKTVPISRVLDYRIVISTVPFDTTPNVAPLALVTLDTNCNVVSVQDARNMMFRLGSGGTLPNDGSFYQWPLGRGTGGDKGLDSFKTWCDAVMTRLWELGGGENWFSPASDRDVQVVYGSSTFASTGTAYEVVGGHIHWQSVKVIFSNSTGDCNVVTDQLTNQAGLTDLAAGECIYVDLDRSQNATIAAKKGVMANLGLGAAPGARIVLAWRPSGGTDVYLRGIANRSGSSWLGVATPSVIGGVKISQTVSGDPIVSVIATGNATPADSFRQAIAGGISRGGGDFFAGPGDVVLGGSSLDQNVTVALSDTGYAFRVMDKDWNQLASVGASGGLFLGANSNPSNRNDPPLPSTPVSGSTLFIRQIRSPDLVGTNLCVDQLCVMWRDGRILVIAESAPYTP